MIIIGVDPGSHKMGYGVIRQTGPDFVYLTCGLIKARTLDPTWRRLVTIGADLEGLCAEVEELRGYGEQVRPAIEAGFVKGQMGALISGASRGVAQFVLGRRFGEVRAYPPATVKLSAAGHGGAGKDQVSRMVCLRLGLKNPPGPDETDALAIALTRGLDDTKTIER